MSTVPTVVLVGTPDGKQYQVTLNSSVGTVKDVTPLPPPPPEPIIPSSALTIDMLTKSWAMNHDLGTPGTASGTSVYPFKMPDGSIVRRNTFLLGGHGGEIYHAQVLADASMYNTFCYELVVSAPTPTGWANVENLETDFEHVWSDGSYVDLAIQLATASGSVEVTENSHWVATKVPANPSKFAATILHTIRHYTRDNGDGTVTYIGSFVDGVYAPIGIVIGSKKSGPWAAKDLNCQLQFDGALVANTTSIIDIHVHKAHCWKS